MSLDRSLKSQAGLVRARNVLTRAERLKILAEEERWSEGDSVFGLPKVRQRKSSAGSKSKAKAGETEETASTENSASASEAEANQQSES